MRNPLKLPTFRRNPDRPTLKARAASLKAGLSRLIHRPAQHGEADQGRRAVMAGTVAAAIPLPALALGHPGAPLIAAVSADPHPDRALPVCSANAAREIRTRILQMTVESQRGRHVEEAQRNRHEARERVPPRGMTREAAAEYRSLSPSTLDRWVSAGRMPPPVPGTHRWGQRAIDLAWDRLSGIAGLNGVTRQGSRLHRPA